MTPAQTKQAEELKALQTKLHSDWLKHPVTVDMFKILDARQANQIKELQEGILISSHEMKEHKYRSSIAALQDRKSVV